MVQTEHLGLCKVCANSAGCVFTRGMKHPTFYCEEFRLEIPETEQLSRTDFSNKPTSRNSGDHEDASLQGLCVDCERRRNCRLITQPEGGVWYCEEYR